MPRTKLDDTKLLDCLTELFCEQGFDGVSLTMIADATGLQRASLYHRYPGGKAEMGLAVLKHAHKRFEEEILAPVSKPGTPVARIRSVARKLDEIYANGQRGCLIDTMSLGRQTPEIKAAVGETMETCAAAFATLARASGCSPAAARQLGLDALLRLHGALVFARATGDTQPFKRFIKTLPQQLGVQA
jgi:TetR/AcrR family transcriptional repressor of lmrAB and yxaGH operons